MQNIPTELKTADLFYLYLGVGAEERSFLEKYASYRYSEVKIPKRKGGKRILLVPEERLMFLQRKVLTLLEHLYLPRAPVHGFIKGRGPISNANAHQKRRYLLNIDLQNYFGTITRRRVLGLFEAMGLSGDVARGLCAVCVTRDQLPQGAPTSPIIANMISYRLDLSLMKFAKEHRFRYTRYADDITFSGYTVPAALFKSGVPTGNKIPVEDLSLDLKAIFDQNGFTINPDKIWFSGPNSRKEVTGLIVNDFTNVKRKFVRNIRSSLHIVHKLGYTTAQEKYKEKYGGTSQLESVIRGRIEWIGQVRGRSFTAYRTLAVQFNLQFPASPIPISPTNEEIAERAVWVIEFGHENECAQGTAFFLDGIGLVTTFHVLSNLPKGQTAEIYRPSELGKKFSAQPSNIACEHRDLMILDHNIPKENFASLLPTKSPSSARQEIIALGFPGFGVGDGLGHRPGTVIGKTTKSAVKYIEVSAILASGISGGPIVNTRYEVIGIAQRGGPDQPKQLAIDISELEKIGTQ
jgi:RNA-directed DNA polymerase